MRHKQKSLMKYKIASIKRSIEATAFISTEVSLFPSQLLQDKCGCTQTTGKIIKTVLNQIQWELSSGSLSTDKIMNLSSAGLSVRNLPSILKEESLSSSSSKRSKEPSATNETSKWLFKIDMSWPQMLIIGAKRRSGAVFHVLLPLPLPTPTPNTRVQL